MSRKTDAKHWYQVNKSRAGTDAVNSSSKVKSAKEAVQTAENELYILKKSIPTDLVSSLRRAFIGKRPAEIQVEGLEKKLVELKRILEAEIANVSHAAQRAYGEDWARRNPELAKKTEKKIK